jgi:hypothetical protein
MGLPTDGAAPSLRDQLVKFLEFVKCVQRWRVLASSPRQQEKTP